MKWCRPKFYTAPGPGGPEEIKFRNRILCAGTSVEGCRGIPRKRGSGGGPAGAVRRPRDTPGGVLVPLPPWAKGLAPQGETLQGAARRVVAPYGCHGPWRTGGPVSRPYNVSGRSQQSRTAEGASPFPTRWLGNILRQRTGGQNSVRRCAGSSPHIDVTVHGGRAATWGRPYYAALAGCLKKTDRKPGKIGGAPLKKMKNTLDTHGDVDV